MRIINNTQNQINNHDNQHKRENLQTETKSKKVQGGAEGGVIQLVTLSKEGRYPVHSQAALHGGRGRATAEDDPTTPWR